MRARAFAAVPSLVRKRPDEVQGFTRKVQTGLGAMYLTVNEVDGQNTITAIAVVDDTVTIPQGLRIYDEEEKLLSILGEAEENGVYTYESGKTILLIQVKAAEDGVRRIATMEYRAAEEG